MKIVMLIDAWFPLIGGGQIHVWELSKQLANNNHDVVIYTRNLGISNESYKNIKVIKVGHFKNFSNILGRIEYLFLALLFCLKENYDILHTHAFSPGLLVPILKFFKNKKPMVFTVHGAGMSISGLSFLNADFLQDLVFYKIPYDLEITVAKKTLNKTVRAKRLVVIPNGVDLDRFKKAQKKREKIKTILYVGRLVYDKGPDLLIDAFKKIDNSDLKLVIVGEGELMENLKNHSEGLNIEFKGRLEGDKLIDAYRQGDLLVMPSRVEGMPLRLFEAWAAKLPVVASKVGDNPEYIKEGETGYLVDVSVDSLSNKISLAVESKDNKKISQRAYKEVQNYTWEKIANLTLKEYQKLYGS